VSGQGISVRCSSCGFENASGIKFCGECGSALKLRCLGCSFENAAGLKFCGECGNPLLEAAKPEPPPDPRSYTPKHLAEKILMSKSALEGERRVVTVLFADCAGFTSIAEKLDPEDVHRIMEGCFERIATEIHRFEGTINQYTGDGIMALFGAPIAHEDGPRRATHAAKLLGSLCTGRSNEVQGHRIDV
jgi:class 3 adenylate cyclase